jgi:hypothetical protein
MRLGVGLGLVLAAVAQLGCCPEPIPDAPSYELDMKPLFHARWVRCHGGGGTLNGDPANPVFGAPTMLWIGSYDDTGVGCELMPLPPTCHQGAHRWAAGIQERVHAKGSIRMPIRPSEPLTSWELELIDRWAANPLP